MAVAIPIIIIIVVGIATVMVAREPARPHDGRAVTRDAPARLVDRAGDCLRGVLLDRSRDNRTRARRRDACDLRERAGQARPRRSGHLGAGRRGGARRVAPAVPQPRPPHHRRLLGRRVRRRVSRLPVADGNRRIRRQGRGREDQRHHRGHPGTSAALLRSRGRARTSSSTRRPTCPKAQEGLQPDHIRGDGSRDSSRSTSAAYTSVAACRGASRRSGSSAPATVPSTTASARRRRARRRVASTASRSSSTAAT